MTEEQISQYIDSFEVEQTRTADFIAAEAGGSDVEILRSEIYRSGENEFILTTYFREFWAGHGWSIEQNVKESMSLNILRKKLVFSYQ